LTNEFYFNMQRPDGKKFLEKMLELSEKHLQADKDLLRPDKDVVELFIYVIVWSALFMSVCELFIYVGLWTIYLCCEL